jgi:hypothetical protein
VNSSGNSTVPNVIDAIRQPFVTSYIAPAAGQKLVVHLNGKPLTVSQPGAVGADTGEAGVTIGNREDYPGFGWNGLISEVLVYDRVLAEAELNDLHQQLSARYGIDSEAAPLTDPPTAESQPLDRQFLVDLYLSAFSREPSSEELELALNHLRTLNDRREGLQDIVWAVLNSKEFLFQH